MQKDITTLPPVPEQPQVDYIELLQLESHTKKQKEIGAREFRIRGIDLIIADLKKILKKEEADALNRYLRMCPGIDQLTLNVKSYKESASLFKDYIPKLHQKIIKYEAEEKKRLSE